MFSTVIQACSVPEVSASGKPEAKPSSRRMAELRWVKIFRYCFDMISLSVPPDGSGGTKYSRINARSA
jgi:hypothetical protein